MNVMEAIIGELGVFDMLYAEDLDVSNQHKLMNLPGRGSSKALDGYSPGLRIGFEWHPYFTHGTPNNVDPGCRTVGSTTATGQWKRTRAIMDAVIKHDDVDFLAYLWMEKPPPDDGDILDHLFLHVPGAPDCSLLAKDCPAFMERLSSMDYE